MQRFDIESLLSFSPARLLCRKCYGLQRELPLDPDTGQPTCQVCGVQYLETDDFSIWDSEKYLDQFGLHLEFSDVVAHCRTLASIARTLRNFYENPRIYSAFSPMRCLLAALQAAQAFVHFVTYGMSLQMVGAIRMTALRVPVRGVISNADARLVKELTDYRLESPGLDVKLFERSDKPEDWEAAPHQKVIVIDGLLAFKGAANFTVEGWRKASHGLDSIEVVTDMKEVMELNNRLFSRVWGGSNIGKQVPMIKDVPF